MGIGDKLYDKAMATKAPGWLQDAGETAYNAIPKKKKKKKKLDFSRVEESRRKKLAKMRAMKEPNQLVAMSGKKDM